MAYFSEQIGLVTPTNTIDDEGYESTTTATVVTVYGNKQSIMQNEFFAAGQQGIDAKYKFTVYASEYDGQTIVLYGGKYYDVYRTYQVKEDLIELYVSESKTEVPSNE